MQKIYTLLLLMILSIFIYTGLNLNKIKPAYASRAIKREYTEYLNVSGEFEKQNNTDITFSYPIIVKDVYIQENQYVNNGQALFTVDKEKMLEIVNTNYNGLLTDYVNSVSPSLTYNDSYSVSDVYSIQDTIYSSGSGIVKNLYVNPGVVLPANKPVLTIENTSDILVRFTVSQNEFGKISVGDKVDIVPVAFKNKNYTGRITDKNAVVKNQTSLTGNKVVIDVFAHIENPDKTVSDGLQVNGKIQNNASYNIYSLEHSYVNQDDYGEYVFILNKGTAEKIYVETGIETTDYVEIKTDFPESVVFIKGDISHGDSVIIVG